MVKQLVNRQKCWLYVYPAMKDGNIWRFPKMGVPLNIRFFFLNSVFHYYYKQSIFGYPKFWETPIWQWIITSFDSSVGAGDFPHCVVRPENSRPDFPMRIHAIRAWISCFPKDGDLRWVTGITVNPSRSSDPTWFNSGPAPSWQINIPIDPLGCGGWLKDLRRTASFWNPYSDLLHQIISDICSTRKIDY
jgi:hypothetical protein